MAAPVDVNVNPSSQTNATSQAGSRVDTGSTFNFGGPTLGLKIPTWAIFAALLIAGAYVWRLSKKR